MLDTYAMISCQTFEKRISMSSSQILQVVFRDIRMKCFYFAILQFSLLFSSEFGFSQKVKIYGNIGIEGANISVLNTQYGTTSDSKGNYALPLFQRDRHVDMLYSCIGYEDTLVSLTPKMLQCDSLCLSFRMREKRYELAQVSVSAHLDFFRTEQGKSVCSAKSQAL